MFLEGMTHIPKLAQKSPLIAQSDKEDKFFLKLQKVAWFIYDSCTSEKNKEFSYKVELKP